MNNCILVPGYNRPEFFYIVMEALMKNPEIADYNVLFALEHGVDPLYYSIIKRFSDSMHYEIVEWPERYGLSKGILEGLKIAEEKSDEYVVIVEDDILVSQDFLRFMDYCYRNYCEEDSYIAAIGASTNRQVGRVDYVYKEQWYLPWGTLIPKYFFEEYMKEHCNEQYYLNSRAYADSFYAIESVGSEVEQANLILRIMKKNNLYQVLPEVPRALEIGFYGKHRYQRVEGYSGKSLQEKIDYTKELIGVE